MAHIFLQLNSSYQVSEQGLQARWQCLPVPKGEVADLIS